MARFPAVACPSPAILRDRREPLVDIELAVVTPMFGGGAVPRKADPLLPVRGAAVRGHLRFWWRACHAHAFVDAAELFRRESEIWGQAAIGGSAAGPSPIQVEVAFPDDGLGQDDSPGMSQPKYALFPFQGEAGAGGEETAAATGRRGVRFRLRLTASPRESPLRMVELRRAAETAVAAWSLFGGVGARTRRGCGSLWCAREYLAPAFVSFRPRASATSAAEAEDWVQVGQPLWIPNLVMGQVAAATTLKVPLLHGARVATGPKAETMPAWVAAVQLMERFSQGENVGRNPGFGRSRWPEADSVRQEWRRLDPNPNHAPVHPARKSYPRADLRLPILLQQMGEEPPVLQGATPGATRMASPVILKALPVSETHAVPLMLMLNAPHVWDGPGVQLASEFGTATLTSSQLQMATNALSPDAPGLMGPGRTIRDAFVIWAEQRWGGPAATL